MREAVTNPSAGAAAVEPLVGPGAGTKLSSLARTAVAEAAAMMTAQEIFLMSMMP